MKIARVKSNYVELCIVCSVVLALSQDPYAVSCRSSIAADAFCNNQRQGLGPGVRQAFAGTTRGGQLNKRRYAARMFAMKRSSSSRKRVLSVERVRAELSTSADAEPVSAAPRLTCMIFAVAASVPCATF
jgi:hypothetical protein